MMNSGIPTEANTIYTTFWWSLMVPKNGILRFLRFALFWLFVESTNSPFPLFWVFSFSWPIRKPGVRVDFSFFGTVWCPSRTSIERVFLLDELPWCWFGPGSSNILGYTIWEVDNNLQSAIMLKIIRNNVKKTTKK